MEIVFKPDEEMRICECGCGKILEKAQRHYASVECMYRSTGWKKKTRKEVKTFPKWMCDNCGEVIQLDFTPCTNSDNYIRFDKIKSEHKCQN